MKNRKRETHMFLSDFPKFKSGVISVEHAEGSGCPSTSKTDKNANQVQELVPENRSINP